MVLVSLMFFLLSFSFGVVSMVVDSPLALGGATVLIVSGVAGVVSVEVSVFMGFTLFMVVVGGMLVVFSYAVALSHGASFNLKKLKLSVFTLILFFTGALHSWVWSEKAMPWSLYQWGVCPLFDLSWGVVSLSLCVLLLVMMVGVADVCKKTGGALVEGGVYSLMISVL